MKMIKDRFTRFCCAVLAAASMQAFGTVITTTYSDRTVWTSAATNLQTITFEGLAPAGGSEGYNSGLKFTDIATFMGYMAADMPQLAVVDSGASSPYYDWNSGAGLLGPTNYRSSALAFLPYIHIVFVTPIKAFGVDLMSTSPNGLKYKIALDATVAVFQDIATYERPTRAFWGVVSDTPFTTVDLSLPEYPDGIWARALIDNVAFGDAAPLGPPPEDVPEACTLLLIGSGLLTMVAVQRRVRRKCRVA